MRAVFLGSPAAAVPSLAGLAEIAEIAAVVTNPDRPQGRGGRIAATPVKQAAVQWGFPLHQPADRDELVSVLQNTSADVAVVVAYGTILSESALATTRVGFVNVHFSVLPRWRGAAPVEHAINAGDEETGVSLMRLDPGLDTGPVIAIRKTSIEPTDTGGSLTARLSALGADLLVDALPAFMTGSLMPADQLDAGVTHANRLTSADGALDAARPAAELERQVRAFHPRPGSWIMVDGVRVKVIKAVEAQSVILPTHRIERVGDIVALGTATEALSLQLVQPAGKPVQAAVDWMNGRRNEPVDASVVGV